MSDFGVPDPNFSSPDLFAGTDWTNSFTPSGEDWWNVQVTPEQTWGLDGSLSPSTPTSNDSGWSASDFAKLFGSIGQTFASTFNAVNNPSSPSAYNQPGPPEAMQSGQQTSGGQYAGASFASFFQSPIGIAAMIGGGLLLVMMLNKED